MESANRVGKYLWPYRRMFFLSVGCALLIALLWGLNLSAAGPVVRVLFENDSLQAYVEQEIRTAQTAIQTETDYLKTLDTDAVTLRARVQGRISDASQDLWLYTWLNRYVVPWLPTDKFNTISLILAAVFLSTLAKCLLVWVQETLVGSIVLLTTNDIRRETFRKALQLDHHSVAAEGTANLMARMTNDVQQLMIGLSVFGTRLVREPLKALACVGLAFALNWRLTLLAVLVVPLIGVTLNRFGKSLKKAAQRSMQSAAQIYDCVAETFDSFRIVLAFGAQSRQRGQFVKANRDYYEQSMKVVRKSALVRPTTEVMAVIAVLVAFAPGAYLVLRNTNEIWGIQLAAEPMTISQLTMLYVLLAGTLDPCRKMSTIFGQLKQGTAAADRIFDVMDRASLVAEPENSIQPARHSKQISFRDISYRYPSNPGDQPRTLALNEVSLNVEFGQVVAVIGGNGSGKSTLLSLLPRFMDPTAGEILIDGLNIRSCRTQDLRSQIGLVTQETMLFNDTIAENIRLARPDATDAEVEAAARQAHALDFIDALPDRFNYVVGTKGQRLSGGQRQRLALARAILRDPAILILDEATSAVDAESEDVIHRVLKEFAKGRTVFIITHVLSESFLDLVDRIVVLDKGHLVADGTHEQLAHTCDSYRRLLQPSTSDRRAA